MINIAQSLASLVKTNNGFFKSVLQARFLLDMVPSKEYVAGRGRSGYVTYFLDDEGVTRVETSTASKGPVYQWEREVEGVVSFQAEKEIKRCRREIKALEKVIAQRDQEYRAGKYNNALMFKQCQTRDIESVHAYKGRIAEYGGKV